MHCGRTFVQLIYILKLTMSLVYAYAAATINGN